MIAEINATWSYPDATVTLRRKVELLFAPPPGMRLVFDGIGDAVKECTWQHETQELWIMLETREITHSTWAEHKEQLLRKPGWALQYVQEKIVP